MTDMIITNELIRMDEIPAELRDMIIFTMSADDITQSHLQGFYYRAKLRTSYGTAKHCAELIAREVTNAYNVGAITNNRLANFSIRPQPMLSGEFRMTLESMDLAERRCLYFALLLNVDVLLTVNLKWNEVQELHRLNAISDAATDVLDSLPRHFKFQYVFWRGDPPERLHDIKTVVELAFGCSYEALRQKFNGMVMVDTALQAQEFKALLGVDHE